MMELREMIAWSIAAVFFCCWIGCKARITYLRIFMSKFLKEKGFSHEEFTETVLRSLGIKKTE